MCIRDRGKPILDKDGKPLTEEKPMQIPAFKVVSVFDVSQTEGEPLPSIAVNELSGSVQAVSYTHLCLITKRMWTSTTGLWPLTSKS